MHALVQQESICDAIGGSAISDGQIPIWNETVPIQLAQCWFHALAVSDAKICSTYGSNFVKQQSETAMV